MSRILNAHDLDLAPSWFKWAYKEIGTRELPENRGPAIRRYISLAHCGEEGDPWCAIFANAALEASGFVGTESPASQSFRHSLNFAKQEVPSLGSITVFWRRTRVSGLGHVGFYVGENNTHVWTLGGNEGDMVQIEALRKDAATFGLIGYYWPKEGPAPKVGRIFVAGGAPVNQVSVV